MAALTKKAYIISTICAIFVNFLFVNCDSDSHAVPPSDISEVLIKSALNFLNGTSDLTNYKPGTLVNAQKLVNPPYVINKLTFNFEPLSMTDTSCPRKACILDVREHELGSIDVLHHTSQCAEFDTKNNSDETLEKIQNIQVQEVFKNLDPQIVQQTTQIDYDVLNTSDELNDRNYVATNPSASGNCPGCPYELNPNLPGLATFVELALQSMDENGNSDFKHKLSSLVKVTRTALSNTNAIIYDLVLEIGVSNCLTASLIERAQCSIQSNLPVQKCLVKFAKQFSRNLNRVTDEITSNNCTDIQNDSSVRASIADTKLNHADNVVNDQIAQEAQEVVRVPLAAPEEKIPKFADKMQEFDEFLKTLDAASTNSAAGLKYPDDSQSKSSDAENTSKHTPIHESIRVQRSSPSKYNRDVVLGAPLPVDQHDTEAKHIITHSFKIFSDTYPGEWEPIFTVRNVTKQIVSGTIYRVQVQVGASTCEKGRTNDCKLQSEESQQECTLEAWSQPWVDKGHPKVNITCDKNNVQRKKRSLRGTNYSQKMLKQAQENFSKEEKLFNEFITTYDKKYDDVEKTHRFKIFKENLDVIEELQRNEQGTAKYGATQFADLTKQEFRQMYLGLKPRTSMDDNHAPHPEAKIPKIELPMEFDWRHYNVVTSVKNQGSCGSCWAFSVTGNIEGQYAIKYGKLYSFSEQELLDCDKIDEACNGGLPDNAYRAIEELGGLELESDYPYDARKETCHIEKSKIKVNVRSGLNITTNETEIAQWIVKNGPVSIGINANAMQFYFGGISHPFKFLCNPKDLDHGVLIVGFGVKNYPVFNKRLPYWIIKNSWGPRWGEQGYYRVYRGDGTCGVNQMVTSAILD